jgi:3D (Asp-Asp-Asp) domain-containing protein
MVALRRMSETAERQEIMTHAKKLFLMAVFLLVFHSSAFAERDASHHTSFSAEKHLWKITAYCSCKSCCGPAAKGITASGAKVSYGMVACNWLAFGTIVEIAGFGRFTVTDRGARSMFGSRKNRIKHLDIYLPKHSLAKSFGVKYLQVKIVKGGE